MKLGTTPVASDAVNYEVVERIPERCPLSH
jgi:hypothetical protein